MFKRTPTFIVLALIAVGCASSHHSQTGASKATAPQTVDTFSNQFAQAIDMIMYQFANTFEPLLCAGVEKGVADLEPVLNLTTEQESAVREALTRQYTEPLENIKKMSEARANGQPVPQEVKDF